MRFQEIRNFMQLRMLVWNIRWVDEVLLFDCLILTNVDRRRRRRRPKTWVHPKSRDWFTNANKSVPLGKPAEKTQAQRYASSSPPFLIHLFGTFVAGVVALLLLAYYSSLCITHACVHAMQARKQANKRVPHTLNSGLHKQLTDDDLKNLLLWKGWISVTKKTQDSWFSVFAFMMAT